MTLFSILSFLSILVRQEPLPNLKESPWKGYCLVAACLTAGRGLTWFALSLVSYPTLLMLKSCKLVVVMVGSTLILNKRYDVLQYLSAVLVMVGLSWFMLADKKARQNTQDTFLGLALSVLSLVADSATSNLQERTLRLHRRPISEVLLCSNFLSALFVFFLAAIADEIGPAIAFGKRSPTIYFFLCMASCLGYLGALAWTTTIKKFGAVVATAAGISRKVMSMCVSYFMFPKPLSLSQVYALVVFFFGLGVSWYHSRAPTVHVDKDKEKDLEMGEATENSQTHRL